MAGRARIVLVDILLLAATAAAVAIGMFLHSTPPPDPTYDRIVASGKLVVGMDATYPPFGFLKDGQFDGYDAELGRRLAQGLGVGVQFQNIPCDGLYDTLAVGKIDVIISALAPTPEFMNDYWYSRPYVDAGQVLVTQRWKPDSAKPETFAGKTIGVELGTRADMVARQTAARTPGLSVLSTYHSINDAVADLKSGRIDGLVTDSVTAYSLGKQYAGLRVINPPLDSDPYVLAVKANSPKLLNNINAMLNQMDTSGDFARLADKWFKEGPGSVQ